MTPEQAAGLRYWARGDLGHEAGVELLIRSRLLSHRAGPWLWDHEHDPEVPEGMVWPEVNLWAASEAGVLSSGERKVFDVMRHLIVHEEWPEVPPPNLGDLQGIDTYESGLILAAVSHAMGLHQRSRGIGQGYRWP